MSLFYNVGAGEMHSAVSALDLMLASCENVVNRGSASFTVPSTYFAVAPSFLALHILLPQNYKMLLVVVSLTLIVVLAGVYYIARHLADALVAITNMYLDDLGHGGLMRYFSTTHKEDRVE